jgi:capsid portal protein
MSAPDDVNEFTANNGSYSLDGLLAISIDLLTRQTIDDYSSNDLIKWYESQFSWILKAFDLNESSNEASKFA